MKATSGWLSIVVLCLNKLSLSLGISLALAVIVTAENIGHSGNAATDYAGAAAHGYARLMPQYALENGDTMEYVGEFTSDAKYRISPRRWFSDVAVLPGPEQKQVPSRMLRSNERLVEAYTPPAHASALVQGESISRRAMSSIATFVYGHSKVLQAPRRVKTDSAQRVIVADPLVPAVHVLDPLGKNSFRILAGPRGRIASATDVAVDADDNIFVLDGVRNAVVVFDRNGRFLREMGTYYGEGLYEHLTAIALDPAAGHIYLTDSPRHLLIMLDLYGNVLKRAGQGSSDSHPGELRRRDVGPKEFDRPSDVALGGSNLVVLDKDGTRIRILDLDCKLLGGFSVQRAAEDTAVGITVDRGGNIFVAYADNSLLRVYSPRGEVLGSFGHEGSGIGQFRNPRGLWIDSANRLYVADTENARVQLFQLKSAAEVTARVAAQ